MNRTLWTGTVASGSVDIPFPYDVPTDQIPVNGDVLPTDYPGEWFFAATAQISVDDFDADTGLLNLHTMVPMAEVSPDGLVVEQAVGIGAVRVRLTRPAFLLIVGPLTRNGHPGHV